jgi:hypothetical protein
MKSQAGYLSVYSGKLRSFYEVLTVQVFCIIASCNVVNWYRHFGGIVYLPSPALNPKGKACNKEGKS